MKKQIVRLTETDLHNIIRASVRRALRENLEDERHVLKIKNQEPPMGDMGMVEPPMPPMDDNMPSEPPMDEPMNNEPPMGNDATDEPPMGDSEPPMDDEPPMGGEGGGNTQEIDDIFNQLDIEDQSAVLKYARSMTNGNGGGDMGNDEPPMGNEPPSNGMPMESRRYKHLDRIIEDVLGREVRGKDRETKRNSKYVTNNNVDGVSPFVSKR